MTRSRLFKLAYYTIACSICVFIDDTVGIDKFYTNVSKTENYEYEQASPLFEPSVILIILLFDISN